MNKINNVVKLITKEIKKAPKIALFHHINPDGDSLSCSYGLLLALKIKFPNKQIVLVGNKKALQTAFPFLEINYEFFVENIDNSYLAIIGDTSVSDRIENFSQFQLAKNKICFDHHQNKNDIEYDIFWKEPSYPASTMQAIEIVKKLAVQLDENSSFFLALGLLTDTGNFVFSLANHLPPLYYSQLLQKISDQKMNKFFNAFKKRTKLDLELQKEFLNSIKFDGKVAYVVFDQKKVNQFPEIDHKHMVNLIGNIENYPIWCLFIHSIDDGLEVWKAHFRSNGPHVSKVAIALGGGGHYRAAGAKIPKTLSIKNVLKKLNDLSEV